jgi:uncharacterized RDD family membrane protein YckC
MVRPATLPSDAALAFTFQRLAGCLIDMVPFALVLAAALGIDWQTALRELGVWATWWAVGTNSGKLPGAATLEWWGLTCAAYTVYALVMELLTRRTVGKTLTGMRVLSEAGQPPGAGQIVVRNVVRLLELLPPVWIMAFLVVLSRNRQRLGDILARTVVVRHLK